jgi:hypothetical protein
VGCQCEVTFAGVKDDPENFMRAAAAAGSLSPS